MEKDLYVPHLSSKIQVSASSRFKVIAFFSLVAEFVIFSGKNTGTSGAKRRKSPNDFVSTVHCCTKSRHHRNMMSHSSLFVSKQLQCL